jgi:predicted metalloprotease with PDZ domain
MSEDHTKSVTVKRTAKKKSGYTVSKDDGEYFVAEAPGKARVNVGDKVVGINGIRAEEFVDEGDANDLIESIRIVVVPEAEIEEYEAAKEAEEAEDGQGKKKGKKPEDGKKGKNIPAETALAVVPNDDGKVSYVQD